MKFGLWTHFPVTLFPSPAIVPMVLFLNSMLAIASVLASQPHHPSLAGGCVANLVALGPCLPYIASPPNNFSSSASSQCCEVFSSTYESSDAACLCYFLRQPLLLGFPLNQTRIASLSSVCPLKNSSSVTTGYLESLCLGSPTLPPLRSKTTEPGLVNSSDFGPSKPPSPSMNFPPEPPESAPTLPSSSGQHATSSSATKKINISSNWFPPVLMISLAPILLYL